MPRTHDEYVTTPDGVRLFVRTIGSGGKTVVIPNGMYFVEDLFSMKAGLKARPTLADDRTVVVYDLRNRGLSDSVGDPAKLARGVHHDVDDLEAVRRHLGLERLDLIGHSYVGLTVALYAMTHPARVNRIVQIAPIQPSQATEYPAHLTCADNVLRDTLAAIGQLQAERAAHDPETFCRKVWELLAAIYVADPGDSGRITWGRCELANERNFMKYWMEHIMPSLRQLSISDDDMARVTVPVLTIHGTHDRSAPYGGGREWAARLPNARLVTVERAGHAPWIEAPDAVVSAIDEFLR